MDQGLRVEFYLHEKCKVRDDKYRVRQLEEQNWMSSVRVPTAVRPRDSWKIYSIIMKKVKGCGHTGGRSLRSEAGTQFVVVRTHSARENATGTGYYQAVRYAIEQRSLVLGRANFHTTPFV